ncbi:B-cell receptor CD22-like [Mastacembelus armatus]|uniref:B-cell receptor CD22-like n=1 Tax=Mastacembelus armatus TaxID=205130 RepID=UPI000E4545FD|nr:B-cell receptor CD22-like [Mastacembelus armatus]
MTGAAMSLTAAASGFVVFLLSVSVVQAQDGWGVTYTATDICAIKGSTVNISCTYTYPSNVRVQETFWFTKGTNRGPVDLKTQSEYSGRVQHQWEDKTCTLTIRDLRETDSAQYKFRFITNQQSGRYTGSPGVTLTVTSSSEDPGLQVQVIKPSPVLYPSWAELTCHSCFLPGRPSYIWYKNGLKIKETPTLDQYFDSPDSYSCAVKGHEGFPSPSVCVKGQSCNRVTYTDRSICAVKGSSVDISCTYNSHDKDIQSKFWFRRQHNWRTRSQPVDLSEDSQFAGRVQVLDPETGRSTLRITDLRETDSAQYHFTFKTPGFEWRSSLPGTTLTVTALQVQVTRIRRVHQSSTEAELKCHSSCSPAGHPSLVWFNNGQEVGQGPNPYRGLIYDGDNIYCAFKGHEKYHSASVYPPKLLSVSVSPSAEIVEGSSVTLTCSSDANPAAKYTWYKKNGNPSLQPASKQFNFSSIQSSDSGEYYCTAENDLGGRTSGSIFINVTYPPKLLSVSVSPSAEIVEGSSLTLTCSSDANPAANFTWYKENQTLIHGPEGTYQFTSISSEDRGTYYCRSENQLGQSNSSSVSIDVQYGPKLLSVSVSPSAEIVEGSPVTLTCSSDANPAANYTWYKENQTLLHGPEGTYQFSSIRSEDSGTYYCRSENQYGQINSEPLLVNVQYGPKLLSVSVSPSAEIVEGSSVTLTCSSDANPAANYTWYKENEESPKASGQIFTITDIRPEHRGKYYCEAQNTRGRHNTTSHLTVVADPLKLPVALTVPAVFLAFMLLPAWLWIRRRRSLDQQCEAEGGPDNSAQVDQLHYASVQFTRNQEDHIYANVSPAQHQADKQEGVIYSTVLSRAGSDPRTRRPAAVEDPSSLYSSVNKRC